MSYTREEEQLFEIFLAVVFLISVPAWFTHVMFCLSTSKFGFLIAGAIYVPIAIVHGVYLWV